MQVGPEIDLTVSKQSCPLCGADDFDVLATTDRHLLGLRTVGCTTCGLLQTNPRPDAAALKVFYEQHYRNVYQGVAKPDASYVANYRKDTRLRYTANYLLDALDLRDDSILLDYGCGEGSLFAALRASGFRGKLAGVEPNPEFARYAAALGNADVKAELSSFNRLDAVVLNHVLEHLVDPIGVLAEIRCRLVKGGLLYVDVPDADRYESVSDLHLAHVLHFTSRTLRTTLKAAGFDIVVCEPHDPPHHPHSLRALARPVVAVVSNGTEFCAHLEQSTWNHLRLLEARRWRWILSRRMASIRIIRKTYYAWRRLCGR
ncbi:MAG: class I SAM-dependent methyltransferase [Alcaligenaceae bacterium]|nr:MAG: class I SAM-dependent methyltransferase [Alcaligenaceae bacterium]